MVPPVLGEEADMWRALPVRRLSVAVCVSLVAVVLASAFHEALVVPVEGLPEGRGRRRSRLLAAG
jgi:hypothetical protein